MEHNPNRRRQALRLLRIALIAFSLLIVTVVLHPQRMLPPDMTLGEFFQAMLGVLMLQARFPRIPGDMGNATTWPFPVLYKVVSGVRTQLATLNYFNGFGESNFVGTATFSAASRSASS